MEDVKFAIKIWLISVGIITAILGVVIVLSIIYSF